MTSDPVALGSRRQYERPDWRPLERFLASDELCDQFMWMCDLALDDGAILNAYKHHDTRRYLYLTDDGRTFEYLGDGRYRCVDPYSALAAAFQNWISAYWRRAVGSQREIRVRMGTPIVEGNRVAVEWWTTALDDDQPATICGCLLLQFGSDGRCRDLREYWNREDDRSAPFPGWGT